MITKTVKTTNGPLKITIPSGRDEITIGMLMDLTPAYGHSFSELEQLSILSGIPSGKEDKVYPDDVTTLCDILDIEACLNLFSDTLQTLAYQIKAFVEVQEIPEGIIIPVGTYKQTFASTIFRSKKRIHVGKYVKVITNLGIAPAGAYMEAKEVIKAEYDEWERIKKEYGNDIEFNPSIHSMCHLLALYFHGPATGEKYNTYNAAQFQDVIKKLSITKALPIARYFFLKYPNLSQPKIKPSRESLKLLRSKQV